MEKEKWTYLFGTDQTDGNGKMKDLLGGKGANLAEMASLGLPVPPGVTITTESCLDFMKSGELKDNLKKQVLGSIENIEAHTGKKFGDKTNPLLFSVRSGAKISMPGMMDTVLNLGLNDETVEGLSKLTGNDRFAWDSYRRFIQMYSNVVMGLNSSLLDAILEDLKRARKAESDTQLSASDLKELTEAYKEFILEETGENFPTDPHEQLWLAISAVFQSWNNPRAIKYREINNYDHNWGTAVTIQSMVFGNMGESSATGVCFTRNPSNGDSVFFGEFLTNAQGEDVVAGIRTPYPLNDSSKNSSNNELPTLSSIMPKAYLRLVEYKELLELHYRDMQDIEFTIEKEKLYILQTRNGKRTTDAAVKIAVNMVSEGLISKTDALYRVAPEDINQLLHPRLSSEGERNLLTKGLPASPGAASGKIAFDSDKAEEYFEAGIKAVLVREETSPEDINGMIASTGILTARGGMTSHAAVVARGMGKPCVSGCQEIHVDAANGSLHIGNLTLKEGDDITIDGETGEVFEGIIDTVPPRFTSEFETFMGWADQHRVLKIRTNADTPKDSELARKFGAEGIGLCRTEHMFFEKDRLFAIREMIFSKNSADRQKALEKLIPYQRQDFVGIFRAMSGLPVNIRLLDPPLHEFLPKGEQETNELAKYLNLSPEEVARRAHELEECNPMLGHRGCRLSITYPEIYKMQVRAIVEAAIICKQSEITVNPEIMIPLVALKEELQHIKEIVNEEIKTVFEEQKETIDYKVGTMIELPRAAITADQLAVEADFFSFGTNDLTQTTYGLSRDDSGKFLPAYINNSLMANDPFVSIDKSGVGFLVNHAAVVGRKSNPEIHLGICGEHGGDPASIKFCQEIGLDYVSCSPYRVPIARLAAAQAAITR